MSLPRPPIVGVPAPGSWEAYMLELVEALDREIADLKRPAGKEKYNPTNVVSTTALDASAATLSDVRNVLGTLISDMKARGNLG